MGRDWNSIMFDDIGIKIQKVAKAIAWFDIVVSIIGGIVMLFYSFMDIEYLWYLIFLAPITVVVGCILAWLSVITLYGFGKLIEDIEEIRKNAPKNPIYENNGFPRAFAKKEVISQENQSNNESSVTTHKWRCDGCGNMRAESPCEYCGKE